MKSLRKSLGLAAAIALVAAAGCKGKVDEIPPEPKKEVPPEPETSEPPNLIKEDIKVGTGPEAKTGDKVKVNYTGRLAKTNFMFDTSVGKKPFEFTVGQGSVIKGWDQGVVGMKVGGKRKLTIPSKLGYGDAGSPPKIPGKATLLFDVELLQIGEDKDAGASDGGASDAGAKPKKKDAGK